MVSVMAMFAMLAGLLVLAMATPAHADCAAAPADVITEQEMVFLATAVEQTDRYARVEVEEIWRGPDLAPTVWLQTSAAELPPWPARLLLRAATSVDADLVPGTPYLIATVDGGFETNTCLVTEASNEVMERLAPDATREPVASGATGQGPGILEGTSGIALAIALVVMSIVALAVGGWLASRRFGATRSTRHDPTDTRTGS